MTSLSSELPSRRPAGKGHPTQQPEAVSSLLEGSWDLVTEVIDKVTMLTITCNPS